MYGEHKDQALLTVQDILIMYLKIQQILHYQEFHKTKVIMEHMLVEVI